jgi:SNF family Na+-dependent transporter
MLFLLGTPIYFLEVTIAQYSGFGAVDVWKAVPPLRGIGICSLLIASIISIYYNVLIAYSIIFFICSFIPKLPWDTCDFYWNDAKCCRSGPEVTCLPGSEAPSKQFFEKFVLEMTEGIEVSGGINW